MEEIKIVKIGGGIIDNENELNKFIEQFSKIKTPKILVHGGGKLATKFANQLHIEVQMIEGRRITNKENLELITMVYAGKINKNIVALLQKNNSNAIGFTGADGNTIISVKRPITSIDYGFVGDIEYVDIATLELLLEQEITPVFCAITHDNNGQLLNTNADTIAAELAAAFAKKYETSLYYCFDKKGVLEDVNDEESVIEQITTEQYQQLIQEKIIANGMLPKLNNSFYAVNQNVNKVCIGKPAMLFNTTEKYTTIQK